MSRQLPRQGSPRRFPVISPTAFPLHIHAMGTVLRCGLPHVARQVSPLTSVAAWRSSTGTRGAGKFSRKEVVRFSRS
jgi:hypothetical protein